jgi:hypothetical protein
MANMENKANLDQASLFTCSFSEQNLEGHQNRKMFAKTRRRSHYRLQHSLLQMNDCVHELSFDQHTSTYIEQEPHSSMTMNASLLKHSDQVILDAIARTVSTFCSLPSSPSNQNRNDSAQRQEINCRPPCYGKELSPQIKRTSLILSDRPSQSHDRSHFQHSSRRSLPIHGKNNRNSLTMGLKKVAKYFKTKTSRNIIYLS